MHIPRTLAVFVLFLVGIHPVFAQNLSIPPRLYVRPGEVCTVDFWADAGIQNLAGIDMVLSFSAKEPGTVPLLTAALADPDDPKEIRLGKMIPGPLVFAHPGVETLSVAIVTAASKGGGNGPGWVLSVPLQTPLTAPSGATYSLTFPKLQALTMDNQLIPCRAGGEIIVDPNLPSTGDVNADQKVNVQDVVLALKFAVQLQEPTEMQQFLGDLPPRDGKINVSDAIALLRTITGINPGKLGN
jgi:hypothetical protein